MKLSEYRRSRSFFDLCQRSLRFQVKCLTFGLYTQVSDSGPLGPLVYVMGKALPGELSCPCDRSCFSYFSSKPYDVTPYLNRRDGSDEGSQLMFLCRMNKNISLIITKFSLLPRALRYLFSSRGRGLVTGTNR